MICCNNNYCNNCYYNQKNNRLELYLPEFGKPVSVDFENLKNPQKFNHLNNQLIAKAAGVKNFKKKGFPRVCDLTAGFGQDAFVLYSLGCQVELVERSPVIAALLQDGLKRADCGLTLYIGEAKDYLENLIKHQDYPDIIYFDPMFPEKNKTALPQKNARILKKIAGLDKDAESVFKLALKAAKNRIIVKRPLYGKMISEQKPDILFKGKTIRFDVYLKKSF